MVFPESKHLAKSETAKIGYCPTVEPFWSSGQPTSCTTGGGVYSAGVSQRALGCKRKGRWPFGIANSLL